MKKLLTLFLLLYGSYSYAQSFNNEWIDYSKTYYKFKSNRTGLFRIPQSTLAGIGWSAIPSEQFKLWRNGQEVTLYASSAGVLPGNGYLEFWGEANDGKPDRVLYRDPVFQHTDKLSLQTDSVVYFLTVDAATTNRRFSDDPNNVSANTLPAEPYFMYTAGTYFRSQINPGFAEVIGENVYSSSYDKGEFYSTPDIRPGAPVTDRQNNLFAFTTGPAVTLKFGAVGNALNTRTIRASVNTTLVKDTTCDYFNDIVVSTSFPASLLASGAADVTFADNATSTTTNDRMVVSFYEMTYPRKFDFANADNFKFNLPATGTGYFLQISNFRYGAVAPVLYDLVYQRKYTGDISTPGLVQFVLPAATLTRNFVLVNEEASNYVNIAAQDFKPKTFVNFNIAANQGNYIIISSPILYNGANGVNPVDEYKNYRSSPDGGSFSAKVYDIDELVDQFAYGIKKHPLSVKNFMRFARARFALTPQYVLLIGHGVAYNSYARYQSDPLADKLNIVPTFGWPASDNLLSSADGASPVPITPIGRLSVVTASEISNYLEKVKEYETVQRTSPNTIAGRGWMKNVVQITGASEPYLGTVLCDYMQNYKTIISDTLVGANVSTFCKSTSTEIEQVSSDQIGKKFDEGFSFFCYFGHSSSTVLEFNISDPNSFNNAGRYGVYSVNGCNAGDFFVFDPQRFNFTPTLSEKFTLAKQRGSVAFLASTHFGIVNYLNIFITSMYNLMGKTDYGASIGKLNRDASQQLIVVSGGGDYHARLHAEEMTLHGDPALKLNFQPLPDYDIEEPQVVINPQFVSIAEDKFSARIKIYNLGKAVKDSITVEIKRQFPDNSIATVQRVKIPGILYTDSLKVDLPIVATRDKGLNKLIITVDADQLVTEVTEANNSVTKEFYIYEDEARPAYPYNYAIVNQPTVKLYASTANPLSGLKQYVMEMDTTELFNSSLKVSKTVSSVGGLLEFDPGISLQDSTVYYWRTALQPAAGGEFHWNNSSFVYLAASSPGFNQSHYYQHLKSDVKRITLAANRQWEFAKVLNNVFLRNAVYPTASGLEANFQNTVNNNIILGAGCAYDELILQVLSPGTFKPMANVYSGGVGLYNSMLSTCGPHREYNFEYLLNSSTSRKRIMDFIDALPDGSFVIARTNSNPNFNGNTYADVWKSDTTLFGSGNSLYHRLYNQGFVQADSFNRPRAFIFMFKKNDPVNFTPKTLFSQSIYDLISLSVDCYTPDTLGFINSPAFGPAKAWKNVHWRGKSVEAVSTDNAFVTVAGIDKDGVESPLYRLDITQQDFDVSAVNAQQYPYLKLKMSNTDSINQTPYQLKYWRIDYDPVPEGAVIPNIYFKAKDITKTVDTLEVGEKFTFGLGFKNISGVSFDSLRIKLYILDRSNVPHFINFSKRKPLIAGDSVRIDYEINAKDYPGMNTLYIDFNPDGDQPEQYHFNNFVFRNFYVREDKTNPLLDVTFDNVHILNKDIVSARPHIQIKLKDDAKFLLLTDTSNLVVQVKFPDNTLRTYQFNTDTLRFTPAASGSNNTATIDFSPAFLNQMNENGDEYQLIVKGRDASGNKAGAADYSINFRVISKPMISNLLNYPNPFTTSTAFVFTLTGSDVPENMKIQILTVTGKIVKEITKQELGPLHIGRNITDYKWDGTDQFGQRLANGVYLYRFVTTLNGKRMDKFTDTGDNTDKFFTKGYGKMYLMK
ncbi:MAG TPA: C25 family cysteine peptidase [Chitinophagaceae bacterium]|nr:C25 family cysteine peptidase [Chitinophagaceae bacterium]